MDEGSSSPVFFLGNHQHDPFLFFSGSLPLTFWDRRFVLFSSITAMPSLMTPPPHDVMLGVFLQMMCVKSSAFPGIWEYWPLVGHKSNTAGSLVQSGLQPDPTAWSASAAQGGWTWNQASSTPLGIVVFLMSL